MLSAKFPRIPALILGLQHSSIVPVRGVCSAMRRKERRSDDDVGVSVGGSFDVETSSREAATAAVGRDV